MIDWCVQCADAGCILSHHKDKKHRMFVYIFVRIMKDALAMFQEPVLFQRVLNDDETYTTVWALDKRFYNKFIYKEPVGEIIGKLWFRKSYWSFMRHMIAESVRDIDLWNDYDFRVEFGKGTVYFMFGRKKWAK